jgi:hypothetical protein
LKQSLSFKRLASVISQAMSVDFASLSTRTYHIRKNGSFVRAEFIAGFLPLWICSLSVDNKV